MLRKYFISIFIFWSLYSFAQVQDSPVLERKISISFNNITLPAALKQLNKQAKVRFSYNSNIIPKGEKIISTYQDESLRQILDDILSGVSLYYKEVNGNILINKRELSDRKLRGKIVESEENSPLPFANVFIDNSTLGVATELDGTFVINNVPDRSFDLVVSYVGYEPRMINYTYDPDKADELLVIELNVDPKMLETIDVPYEKPKKRERRERKLLQKFLTEFLGQGENSKDCRIVNPEVFDIVELVSDNSYRVTADDIVFIENMALGYRISYYLDEFVFINGAQSIKGQARFQELPPKSRRQNRQWESAREKSYNGSVSHFLNALIENNLKEEGFQVNIVQFDSVTSEYSTTLNPPPIEEILTLTPTEDPFKYLMKTNSDIEITYTRETEDSEYVKQFRSQSKSGTYKYTDRKSRSRIETGNQIVQVILQSEESASQLYQKSVILFNNRQLIINYPGVFNNDDDVQYLGWWNWGGISEILPLDYNPDN
jgi:hypothetical protein